MDLLMDKKILLIDDDEGIRSSLSMLLRIRGYNLVALESAEQAIEIIERERFDIIVCDYLLPGVNGLEFFKLVQKRHPHTIRILITAYGRDIDVVSETFRTVIDEFIEKPLSGDAIEASMIRLIEKRLRKSE